MNQPIPDQLRQWHAQFIAGEVLFSHIMAEIDAAIACYIDPLTPDNVIELAQLYVLKIALTDAARQQAWFSLALMTRLDYVAQALDLAELWSDELPEYFKRLVEIYTALPGENIPLLHKLYNLMDQEAGMAPEALIKLLVRRGKVEAAWHWARQTYYLQYQFFLLSSSIDTGGLELVYECWNAQTTFVEDRVPQGADLAVALHHSGRAREAKVVLAQIEPVLAKFHIASLRSNAVWCVVRAYLQIGKEDAAIRLLHLYQWDNTEKLLFGTYNIFVDLQRIFADENAWTPDRLNDLYTRLNERYQMSVFGVTIAERLVTLGAQDRALPMFRQQVHELELRLYVLQQLQKMRATETITQIVEQLQKQVEDAESPYQKDKLRLQMAEVLFILQKYDEALQIFNGIKRVANERQIAMKSWLVRLAQLKDWAGLVALVLRWTTTGHSNPLNLVFELLCSTAELIYTYDRQQALTWTEQALAMPSVYRKNTQSHYQVIICQLLLILGEHARLEQIIIDLNINPRRIFTLAEQYLQQNQPEFAIRLFRLMTDAYASATLQNLQTELGQINTGSVLSLAKPHDLVRYWQRNASNITDFIAAFTDTIPLMHAIAPDLPRRTLEACVMLLDEFMSRKQFA